MPRKNSNVAGTQQKAPKVVQRQKDKVLQKNKNRVPGSNKKKATPYTNQWGSSKG